MNRSSGHDVCDVACHITSQKTTIVSAFILCMIVTGSVAGFYQLHRCPIALGTDLSSFFVFLTPPKLVLGVLPSSAVTRLVIAAPHLSRVVEDLSSAVTHGVITNALVSASICPRVETSVPGKCNVDVEEEE